MVLAVLRRLDTMDTVMIMVLVRDITNFIHRDLRVMALAVLVVLLDLDLDPVLMDSNLRGLQVRVCKGMGMDLGMGILNTTGMDRMGGEVEVEVCFEITWFERRFCLLMWELVTKYVDRLTRLRDGEECGENILGVYCPLSGLCTSWAVLSFYFGCIYTNNQRSFSSFLFFARES